MFKPRGGGAHPPHPTRMYATVAHRKVHEMKVVLPKDVLPRDKLPAAVITVIALLLQVKP